MGKNIPEVFIEAFQIRDANGNPTWRLDDNGITNIAGSSEVFGVEGDFTIGRRFLAGGADEGDTETDVNFKFINSSGVGEEIFKVNRQAAGDKIVFGQWSNGNVNSFAINLNQAQNEMTMDLVRTDFNYGGVDRDFRIRSINEDNIFYVDAANDRIGIGVQAPDDRFHVFGGNLRVTNSSDPTIRISEGNSATSYTEIIDLTNSQLKINKITELGSTLLDLNPMPSNGVGNATVRLFRTTNTTGVRSLEFKRGDNSLTDIHVIGSTEVTFNSNGSDNIPFKIKKTDGVADIVSIDPSTDAITLDGTTLTLTSPADAATLSNAPTGGTALAIATVGYVNNSNKLPQRSETTVVTTTTSDCTIWMDGTFNCNVHTAVGNDGQTLNLANSGTGTITLVGATIHSSVPLTMPAGDIRNLQSDGTNWRLFA